MYSATMRDKALPMVRQAIFERTVKDQLVAEGYEVLCHGWPDICAVKREGDKVTARLIEVKAKGDRLQPHQIALHDVLRILGLNLEVIYERSQAAISRRPTARRRFGHGGLIKPKNSSFWTLLVRHNGKQLRRATKLKHSSPHGKEVNRGAAALKLRELILSLRAGTNIIGASS